MKSNVKRFLSTLCVLASVSGVLAPTLVNASSTREEYGADFSSAAADDDVVVVKKIVPLIHRNHQIVYDEDHEKDYFKYHQELYDMVMELYEKKEISLLTAYMIVVLDQMVESCKLEWMFKEPDIEESITTGKWDKEKMENFYIYCLGPSGDMRCNEMENRAISFLLDDYRDHISKEDDSTLEKSLKKSLEKLNPKNEIGISRFIFTYD